MDFDLHYELDQSGPILPLLRAKPYLLKYGINIVDRANSKPRPRSGIIIMAQQKLVSDWLLHQGVPIVLLERADAAISWARKETVSPSVKLVFKIGCLKPPKLNNHCWGRYHASILDPRLLKPPSIILSDEALAKIHPWASYGAYDMMKLWQTANVSFTKPRKKVLNFIGTVDYGKRIEITRHRHELLKKLGSMSFEKVVMPGRVIQRATYDGYLLDSQICVSPWGFGELAYRDYEAFYAGCVLIKPDTSFVRTWPNVLENGITYFPCKPDWSDLKDVIETVRSKWDSLVDMRMSNRQTLLDHWSGQRFADYLAPLLLGLS
jgi:hypothetical protein